MEKQTDLKFEVKDYPYGFRLRTTAFYSLEYKSGKGFRSVFQTINPRTGLLNKPKHSTYSPVLYMYKNEADGHIKYKGCSFYDDEDKIRDIKFMYEHFDEYKEKEIEGIAIDIVNILRMDIRAKEIYCGSDIKKLLPLYKTAVETLLEIMKTKQNLFDKVVIDFDEVKKLEVPGYDPFVRTTHTFIPS